MNDLIIENLEKIADYYDQLKNSGDKKAGWKARSYKNAIGTIIECDKDLKSGTEAQKLSGIGKSIAEKIDHIIKNGSFPLHLLANISTAPQSSIKSVPTSSKSVPPKMKSPKQANVPKVIIKGLDEFPADIDEENDVKKLEIKNYGKKRKGSGKLMNFIKVSSANPKPNLNVSLNTKQKIKEAPLKVNKSDYNSVMKMFNCVWGAGPVRCKTWWNKGCRTLQDLEKVPDLMTRQQLIGLKYYEEFMEKIPRKEVARVGIAVHKVLQDCDSDFIMQVCGSYRRGCAESGDIDILITHPKFPTAKSLEGMLPKLVGLLTDYKVLTDHLSLGNDKYMGVCGINGKHRRIDIKMIPYKEWWYALLYFTGSASLNKRMRTKAIKMGMKLNEKGLYEANSGKRLNADSEKEIFKHLDMKYLEPTQRKY
jgi:DNA polymerase/3'-5' exonuclease PolX